VCVERMMDGLMHNMTIRFCCLNGKQPPDARLAVRHMPSVGMFNSQ
jgi:hypothetical protein